MKMPCSRFDWENACSASEWHASTPNSRARTPTEQNKTPLAAEQNHQRNQSLLSVEAPLLLVSPPLWLRCRAGRSSICTPTSPMTYCSDPLGCYQQEARNVPTSAKAWYLLSMALPQTLEYTSVHASTLDFYVNTWCASVSGHADMPKFG